MTLVLPGGWKGGQIYRLYSLRLSFSLRKSWTCKVKSSRLIVLTCFSTRRILRAARPWNICIDARFNENGIWPESSNARKVQRSYSKYSFLSLANRSCPRSHKMPPCFYVNLETRSQARMLKTLSLLHILISVPFPIFRKVIFWEKSVPSLHWGFTVVQTHWQLNLTS